MNMRNKLYFKKKQINWNKFNYLDKRYFYIIIEGPYGMDEQYWDALTDRVRSAETFLRKSCYSHSPDLIERDMQPVSSTGERSGTDIGTELAKTQDSVAFGSARTLPATFAPLTTTLEDGRLGFKNLVQINNIAVLTGPFLIGLAAISGIALQNGVVTLIFGLLGTSIIIAMFLLRPAEEIKASLANLIQAETVSTDFCNQVQFWAPYALASTNMEERLRASQALHDATTFALKALHDYVEPVPSRQLKIKEL
jgi:hypothetical protein